MERNNLNRIKILWYNKNIKSKNKDNEYVGNFLIDELNTILGGIKAGYHYEFNFYITNCKFQPGVHSLHTQYKAIENKLKSGIRKRNVFNVVRGLKYNLYHKFLDLQKTGKIIILDRIQETRSNYEYVKKLGITDKEMEREYEKGIPFFQNLVLDNERHLQRRRHIKEFLNSNGTVIEFDTTFEPEEKESPLRHIRELKFLVDCPYDKNILINFYFNANLFDAIKKLNRKDENLSKDELNNIDFTDPDLRIYKNSHIEVTGLKLTDRIRTEHSFSLKLNILNSNLERFDSFSSLIFDQKYL